MSRWRYVAGAAGPLVFTATWAVLGQRVSGYSPVIDPISRLAAVGAPYRWEMTAGLVAFAAGTSAYASNLRVALPGCAGTMALGCAAGTIGIALTPLDGTGGGAPHALAAAVTYAALAATPLAAARPLADHGRQGAARVTRALGLATGVCLGASALPLGHAGLWQRLGLVLGDLWLAGGAVVGLARERRCPLAARPHRGSHDRSRL